MTGAATQAIPPSWAARTTPAAPTTATGTSGRRLRVMAANSWEAITAATAAGRATHQPPRRVTYRATAASGTASTTRETSWLIGVRTFAAGPHRLAARPPG